jgi:two-component system CheB/CheR fusion protein
LEKALAEYLSHAPVFIRTLDGVIVHWTGGAQELYGFAAAEAEGHCAHSLLRTEFPEPLQRINQRLQDNGEWRGRLRHTTRDGREIWTVSNWRLRAAKPQDRPLVVEINTDITDRVAIERQRELLVEELNHRVKNTLAIVQAIARLSFADADKACVRRFEQRLVALAQAHSLLVREQWEYAELKDVVAGVAGSLNVRERICAEGPDVQLRPTSAVSYTLAIHELCTNAIKHGALSSPDGRVEIAWELLDSGKIHLLWREIGGPQVRPPAHRGFGSALIERALAGELGSPVQMRFEPTGLVCEFDGRVQKTPRVPAPASRVAQPG